jgi:hypothetical protein
MKISDAKQEVFKLTCTSNTIKLKQERPDLTNGKDLRYKKQWLSILDLVHSFRIQGLDLSIVDLENSEQMLKKSLFIIGKMVGVNENRLNIDWQVIKLESCFSDIHIEEL